jgi:hypothetical protein
MYVMTLKLSNSHHYVKLLHHAPQIVLSKTHDTGDEYHFFAQDGAVHCNALHKVKLTTIIFI